jgi:V8-like Glu-specific endopeptidase
MVAVVAGAAIAAGALAAIPLAATAIASPARPADPARPASGATGYPVVQGAPGHDAQAAAARYWTPARMSAALRGADGGPQSGQAAKTGKAGKKTGKGQKHGKKAAPGSRAPVAKQKPPKAGKKHAAATAHPPRVPAVTVRHLVKQAPSTPAPGPWMTGDTAGQGLRWTHGGPVSSAVGKVFFSSGGTDYVCSGTLIGSGKTETVLTAAHCVSGGTGKDGRPRWVSNWVFVPGYRNGLMPYGMYTAQRFFAARGWTGPQGGTEQYDVAFVQIAAATLYGKSGAAVPPHGLTVAFAASQDSGAPSRAWVFGYPSQAPFTGLYPNYCAGPVTASGGSVRATCGMTAGDSGGPWLPEFSPDSGSGPVVAVSTYKVSTDLRTLYGAVLGPQARAIYQRAVSTAH